ncbi:galactose oxidase [Gigaspora margarita]|uniref:Galactose oxidase n=1 Tax=Gigaspora margarita TaxID=4874 RepID=A0A8H3X5B7_GIGMA|nr:galactose oxidase [Gigaspora margarita]
MNFQSFFCKFFTLYSGTIFLVTCQFIPSQRYLQTSIIVNETKWYFFGGNIGNGETDTNEVFYLKLSKSFNTNSPSWVKDQIGSPLTNILSASCITADNSSIFIIGGVMLDPATQNFVPNQPAVYKYSLNNSNWEAPNITGIDNFANCGGLQSINDNTGRIFLYGGMLNFSEVCNRMSIFDINNMSWLTINLSTSRIGYTATLHKSGNITYIGGRLTSIYSSYISMNEIQIFDTNSLSWHNVTASGDYIDIRAFHTAVLIRDSKILIFGGSITNLAIISKPELATLDTNIYPFKWAALYADNSTAAPSTSLTSHSALLYDDFMVIAFGLL